MSILNIVNLLGGLGLFLFGMNYMSDGINQVAGKRMKDLLEKLTRNRLKGFLLGVFVTSIIQSSSATTVMLMGFLNAGIMDLAQATGVILGAHIGTTITAVLIALDVSVISTACIFIGSVLVIFARKQNKVYTGEIILGFGLLFFGLKYMSGDQAMGVLKSSAAFKAFITSANNPFVGLAVGTIMCAILQSSSASIGVLQVLALQGLMPMKFAIYMIIGVNVGSAMPLFLSSIGAKTNAKRAALVYFIFDVVGMLIFTPIAFFTPYTSFITSLSPNGSVQVAIGHIIFKVVTALILLPFVNVIVRFTTRIIPSREHASDLRFLYIDPKLVEYNASMIASIEKEVQRMVDLVRWNFVHACEAFMTRDLSNEEEILHNEEIINWLNNNLTDYIIMVTSRPIGKIESARVGRLFHVLIDLERIGDHAINILTRTKTSINDELTYSSSSLDEFKEIYENVIVLFDQSIQSFNQEKPFEEYQTGLLNLRNFIRDLNNKALDDHIVRLRAHKCHTASGIVFTKILQDLERTGNHSYNISKAGTNDAALISQM